MNKYSVNEMFHEGQLSIACEAMRLAEKRCRLRIKDTYYDSTSGRLLVKMVGSKLGFCKYFIIRDLNELKEDLKNVIKMK